MISKGCEPDVPYRHLTPPASLRLFSLPSQDSPQSAFFSPFSLKTTEGSQNRSIQSQRDAAYVTPTVASEPDTLSSPFTLDNGCPRHSLEQEELGKKTKEQAHFTPHHSPSPTRAPACHLGLITHTHPLLRSLGADGFAPRLHQNTVSFSRVPSPQPGQPVLRNPS